MTTLTAERPLVVPDDVYNQALVRNVHPLDWANPVPAGRYNLVVLGAGTAGLVSAVGAASLGARVAIIERHLLGGDCLNYGCVPSKALIRAARAAAAAGGAADLGVRPGGRPAIDFADVMSRLRAVRADISHHDSAARLAGLGIDVFFGQARFASPETLEVDGRTLRFSRAVIATGARAAVPPIPGLADAGYLTNESVFSLTARPARLAVIGGGPIGCELAQAFRRLGSEVTLISDSPTLLPREDPDAEAILQRVFEREGVRLVLDATVARVERRTGSMETQVVVTRAGVDTTIAADELLVAVGRAPNVEGLDLDRAGVSAGQAGVQVDDRLRTTNRRIFAAGDVASPFKFTHAADAMARIALQNALFFGRKQASALVIPWATYTDPEIAHVGLSARDAGDRAGARTLTIPLADVDRARVDGESEGFARVHVDARGRILGATLVSAHAGDLIGEMSLAMTAGLGLGTLSKTIHPYPTRAEVWKKLGDAWNRTKLTPRVRALFEMMLRWRR
jgi:pyruvate/2-oxoglutarate dehydrogenase complex dihydrolipoamide dehydrogenase (E3) component